MAPRNGGVTNDAITSKRTKFRNGRSVRETSQLMGAATAQQITLALVARMKVVSNGSMNVGSETSCQKLSSVKAPSRSTTLK